MSDLLTVAEVCERVRLSPWAVRRAIKRGELAATKPAGRLRIPAAAVDAWLRASAVMPDVADTEPSARPLPRTFPRSNGRFRACLEDEHAHA